MFQNLRSKKYMRRLILFLVLVAPLVYLFGSLFCYLLGSHGSFDLSQSDLFQEFFASDNFLASIGADVIGQTAVGFTPYADFLYFIDGNMLHLGSNAIGLTAYGYAYYLLNVITIYMGVVLVAKLVLLPLKAVEIFEKEDRF